MADDITIRQAAVDDAPIIAHHRWAMFADMGANDPAELAAMNEVFLPYVRRALAGGSYRGWLACERDGRVVAGGGLLVYEWPARPGQPDPRCAYVLNMYTEPEYRRHGIARRIVSAIIDWCRREGFKNVSLHASADGWHLYESMGFEPTNEMRLKL